MYILIHFHPACERDSYIFIVLKPFNFMLSEDGGQALETMCLGVTIPVNEVSEFAFEIDISFPIVIY